MKENKSGLKIISIPKLDSGVRLGLSLFGENHQRLCFKDTQIYSNKSQNMDLFELVVDYKEGLIDYVEYCIQFNFLKFNFFNLFKKKSFDERYVFKGEFDFKLEKGLLVMDKASIEGKTIEVGTLESELEKLNEFTSGLTIENTIRPNDGFYKIPFLSYDGNFKSFVFPHKI